MGIHSRTGREVCGAAPQVTHLALLNAGPAAQVRGAAQLVNHSDLGERVVATKKFALGQHFTKNASRAPHINGKGSSRILIQQLKGSYMNVGDKNESRVDSEPIIVLGPSKVKVKRWRRASPFTHLRWPVPHRHNLEHITHGQRRVVYTKTFKLC
jgi:hypothetical protein